MDVYKLSEILVKKSGIEKRKLRNKWHIRNAFYFAVDHIPSRICPFLISLNINFS